MNTLLRRSGIARVLDSSDLTVLPAHPHSSANGMNYTCHCLPSWSWY